jgi:hypothetical protein
VVEHSFSGGRVEYGATMGIIQGYCNSKGIDFHQGLRGFKQLGELNRQQQVELASEFVERTGMIVDEAAWENNEGLDRLVGRIFRSISIR